PRASGDDDGGAHGRDPARLPPGRRARRRCDRGDRLCGAERRSGRGHDRFRAPRAARPRSRRGRGCAPGAGHVRGTVPGTWPGETRRLDRGGRLGRGRRLFAPQALDQVRDVGELLLEVALVALEPLEDVLAAVPAAPERRPETTANVMTVHGQLPFKRARKASTLTS